MRAVLLIALALGTVPSFAEIRSCGCDPAKPETLAERPCSLDRSLKDDSSSAPVLFLKDINPTKPNRTLVLPRVNVVRLSELTAAQRLEYWQAAIAKAQELWGGEWGLAMNGELARTQCHLHAHIGKLNANTEIEGGVLVDSPDLIPLPEGNTGMWVHPVGGKLHVHTGQQINETVLMR